ncbi:hypothetical protein A4S06_11610 [Erysipelotrichaceae bacterium MTC7]|nr:hypothetical protein A4S06_11610 [Erysipelotrichaceae bacterium MTC7]
MNTIKKDIDKLIKKRSVIEAKRAEANVKWDKELSEIDEKLVPLQKISNKMGMLQKEALKVLGAGKPHTGENLTNEDQ